MQISNPEIFHKNGEIVYRVHIESSEGPETLWYSVGEQFSDLVTDFCDAPLVALLIPAMARGEDIHIAGKISTKLFYNVSGHYKRLLQYVIPLLKRIKIYPDEVQPEVHGGSGVATGFSGGIDSFCVLADLYYSDIPEGFKITHLFFNNVGSHGKYGIGAERLFKERYARLEPLVKRLGLPFIKINSNVDAFYGEGLGFQQTHTPSNASVALLLQRGIRRYIYASTYNYTDAFVGPTYDMAYSDTVALPLLSTERLEAFTVGSEYTRVEKTLRVANIADSHDALDVCVSPDDKARNCSTCWKCLRTLLTLDIAGLLNRYSTSFDLDAYERQRNRYIVSVLSSHHPLLREIVQFAKQRRYSFPLSSRLYARLPYSTSHIKCIARLLIRAAHKLKRILRLK